jgi:hypothetical protein
MTPAIHQESRLLAKEMDTRVKPAYDKLASVNLSLILFTKMAASAG